MSGPNTRGKTIAERIEYYSIPVPFAGCHIWTGGTNKRGYGVISLGGQLAGMAHRAAWEVRNGAIPDGMHVLHRCDTPSCVNPDHLFLGTNRDNINDKVAKGRAKLGNKVDRRGIKNPACILSEDLVREIRRSTGTYKAISARLSISFGTVASIKTGRSWKSLKSERLNNG